MEGLLRSLRDHSSRLLLMLIAINALNLADYLLTLNCLSNGGGEANPVMAWLLGADVVSAGAFKMAMVLGVSLILWRYRRYRRAILTTLVILAAFVALYVYHMVGLAFLL
jgi:hypothetical protein